MKCDRHSFGLIQCFDVDGGALHGLTESEAFTLGVEWGIVWGRLKAPSAFAETVHRRNEERIAAVLTAQGRRFETSPGPVGFVTFSVSGLD